jgi:hypothetical protein
MYVNEVQKMLIDDFLDEEGNEVFVEVLSSPSFVTLSGYEFVFNPVNAG